MTCLWGLEVQKHDYYLPKIYIVSDMKAEEFLSGTILGCICLARKCFVWRSKKFMMVHILNTMLCCVGWTHAHIPLHHLKAQRAAWCYSSVSSEDRSEDMTLFTPSLRRQETSYELSLGGLCPADIAEGQWNPQPHSRGLRKAGWLRDQSMQHWRTVSRGGLDRNPKVLGISASHALTPGLLAVKASIKAPVVVGGRKERVWERQKSTSTSVCNVYIS